MPIMAESEIGKICIPEECLERYLPLQSPEGQPLRDAGVWLAGISHLMPGYFAERRNADYHVIIYTFGGLGLLTTPDGVTELRSGSILTAPAGREYCYEVKRRDWQVVWFHLTDREPWRHLRNTPVQVRPSLLLHDILVAGQGFLAASIPSELSSSRLAYLFAEQLLVYLELELTSSDSPHERAVRRNLDDLWNYVNARLNQPWSVADLARRMNMSHSHFHRTVVRHNGHTPQAMINRLRMQRAEELLLHYDLGLKSIADQLGYDSPYAFSRAFKRHKGISPASYRNENRPV